MFEKRKTLLGQFSSTAKSALNTIETTAETVNIVADTLRDYAIANRNSIRMDIEAESLVEKFEHQQLLKAIADEQAKLTAEPAVVQEGQS